MKKLRLPAILKFTNFSIRYKLFAAFLLVVSIPFLLLLYIHLNLTQRESHAQALFSSHQVLNETKSYVGFKADALLEAANFIAFNNLVQESVRSDPGPYEDVSQWHVRALELTKLLNQVRINKDIDNIQLYMKRGLAVATESPDYLDMNKVTGEPWYAVLAKSQASYTWMSASALGDGESENMTLLRKIPDAHNMREFAGIVRMEVKKNAFQAALDHAVITPSASVALISARGEILNASAQFPYFSEQWTDILEQYPDSTEPDGDWNDQVMAGGAKVLMGVQAVPRTDMMVALIVPDADISAATVKARNRLISIFLLVVPLMLPLSFVMAATATTRIRRLIKQVRQVRHGNFQLAELPANEDEIGELTRNINVMVHNMSNLMEETYTLGREVKNKELKALQAQINPHFLYNTLDLINVLAIESGAGDISNVVGKLALFYKLSLSNGKETVPLANELQHIDAYVHIQNMRFGGAIRLIIGVPAQWQDCIVPKIVLQPIVENAVLHGIMEKDEEQGSIRISARADGADLVIEIEDDGIGMPAGDLNTIWREGRGRTSGGFGLRNIQERLHLLYGHGYGLEIGIPRQPGTLVRIRLPIVREAVDSRYDTPEEAIS